MKCITTSLMGSYSSFNLRTKTRSAHFLLYNPDATHHFLQKISAALMVLRKLFAMCALASLPKTYIGYLLAIKHGLVRKRVYVSYSAVQCNSNQQQAKQCSN
eukprot:scaffold673112_cov69-Prasinocladus_malaysianus.AAC.1